MGLTLIGSGLFARGAKEGGGEATYQRRRDFDVRKLVILRVTQAELHSTLDWLAPQSIP